MENDIYRNTNKVPHFPTPDVTFRILKFHDLEESKSVSFIVIKKIREVSQFFTEFQYDMNFHHRNFVGIVIVEMGESEVIRVHFHC